MHDQESLFNDDPFRVVEQTTFCDDLVYVMYDRGDARIGYTSRPVGERLRELRTARPEIILLGARRGDRKMETDLHAHFAPRHLGGDWFRSSDEIRDVALGWLPDDILRGWYERRHGRVIEWGQWWKKNPACERLWLISYVMHVETHSPDVGIAAARIADIVTTDARIGPQTPELIEPMAVVEAAKPVATKEF